MGPEHRGDEPHVRVLGGIHEDRHAVLGTVHFGDDSVAWIEGRV
jgi:hypothetical protein